jgi:hypothetical protein
VVKRAEGLSVGMRGAGSFGCMSEQWPFLIVLLFDSSISLLHASNSECRGRNTEILIQIKARRRKTLAVLVQMRIPGYAS